jgi:hypothetical protein
MFRLPLGVAKGRRGRFHAAFKHPGHQGNPWWLVLFLAEALPLKGKCSPAPILLPHETFQTSEYANGKKQFPVIHDRLERFPQPRLGEDGLLAV